MPNIPQNNFSLSALKAYKNTIIIAIIVILGIGVATAAYVFKGGSVSGPAGSAESYLPSNATAVMTVDLSSTETRLNLQSLIAQFTKDTSLDNWKKWVEKSTDKSPESVANKEIADLIGSAQRTVIAITTPNNQATGYGAMVVKDELTFDALVAKLKTVAGYSTEDYKGHAILMNTKVGFFASRDGNMVVAASSKAGVQQLLDHAFAVNSLEKSAEYSDGTKLTKNSFVSFYVKPSVLLELAGQSPALSSDPTAKQQFAQIQESLKFLKAVSGGVDLLADGLSVNSVSYGDKAIMDTMKFKFNELPTHDAYLAGAVPSGNTVYYSEGYNLNKAFSTSLKISPIASTAEFTQVIEGVKSGLQSLGLNLETDVYPLFTKGTGFAFQTDTGNLFPRLTLVTDVSSNEDSAKKVLDTLSTTLDALIAKLNAGGPDSTVPSGMVTKSTNKVGTSDFMTVKVNVASLIPLLGDKVPADLKKTLEQLKVELWMGITDKKYLIFSTTSDFGTRKDSIATDKDFQAGLRKVGDKGQGIGYFNFQNAILFIDPLYRLAVNNGVMTSDPNATFTKFTDAIKPLRYGFFSTSSDDYTTTGTGFIKIGDK